MIAALQVFVIIKESLEEVKYRQEINQRVGLRIKHSATPIAEGFQRFIRVMASDEHQSRLQFVDPSLQMVGLCLLLGLHRTSHHYLPVMMA
jgi:hypothetical protein